MPWASCRRNHKRPWLPPNNEWGQVRPHRPEGNTLLSFAERGSSYHLNDCHIVSFLWGRPQLVTSGWVQRIPRSDRGDFGYPWCIWLGLLWRLSHLLGVPTHFLRRFCWMATARLCHTVHYLISTDTFHFPYCASCKSVRLFSTRISVFFNRRAAARYRALTSIIPGREMISWNLSY